MIEKVKKSVHKELLQVLSKAAKTTNRLPNPVTISEKEAMFAPCDDYIQQTLFDTKRLCKLIIDLPRKSIRKLNSLIKHTDWNSLSNDEINEKRQQFSRIANKYKNNHLFMETRAQKKKRFEALQRQQQEERKEKTPEIQIWQQS